MVIESEPRLTFADVLLAPGKTTFTPDTIDTHVSLGPGLGLGVPIISSPMDTVTEAPMAEAMARVGALGIIHRYLTPAAQAALVAKVSGQGLLVGAAIGTRPADQIRAHQLIQAGAKLIVIDTAHGHTKFALDTLRQLKQRYVDMHVMVGNIASVAAAQDLIEAGADSLRVGMGPGAICTTRLVAGVGVPQLSAIIDIVKIARPKGIPVIADGGIEATGDLVKALAAGASAVMLGRMLAGTTEAAGERVELSQAVVAKRWPDLLVPGVKSYSFKRYRGMGSLEAIEHGRQAQAKSADYHEQAFSKQVVVAEGVAGLVPATTSIEEHVASLMQGARQGFYYTGSRTVEELWDKAKFLTITAASQNESRAHDILLG